MNPFFAIATVIAASAPQLPVAAGPFASLGEVVEAAHKCGIERLRIETYDLPQAGEVRLFLMEEISPSAKQCLMSWETKNGNRLHLKPRWWKDDFTKDAP